MSTFQNAPCKLCGVTAKLIKRSHIIPEFMYNGVFDEKHRMAMVELNKEIQNRKWSQSGPHEKYILCAKCEAKFSLWERYMALVLYGGNSKDSLKTENQITPDGIHVVCLTGIDYSKAKLFFLSILWRAHISQIPFFKKVDIHALESEIRKMLVNEECNEDASYKVGIIGIKKFDKKLVNVVIEPAVLQIGSGEVAIFFINGLLYFIELNKATGFILLDENCLTPSGQIHIPIVEGELAKELLEAIGVKKEFVDYFIDFKRNA